MTGNQKGAIVLIEKDLGKVLVYLACRHHELETLPKHLFEHLIEKSSSPDLGTLCSSFRQQWEAMDHDHTNYRPTVEDPEQDILTPEMAKNMIEFCTRILQRKMIRCDYQYFAELVMIYLGEVPPTQPNGVYFHPPIAISSARFMARIIYSLSIEMFGATGEFAVSKETLKSLRDLNTFVIINYLEPWFTATEGISAPRTDLALLHNIIDYAEHNEQVSSIALAAFKQHLWYLSPHCVALAFYDDYVSVEIKRKMVENLSTKGSRGRPPLKFVVTKKTQTVTLRALDLPKCVNQDTLYFFEALDLSQEILENDPSEWPNDPVYRKDQETLKTLQVVNDTAERGVALIKNFNGSITKNEDDFQNLLLVQRKLKAEEKEESLTVQYYCPIKIEQ